MTTAAAKKPMHPLGLFIGAIEHRLRKANIARRREIIEQRVRRIPAWGGDIEKWEASLKAEARPS